MDTCAFNTTRPQDLLVPNLSPGERRARIEALYLKYGMPLRYYLLKSGCAPNADEAEELAHAFFARVCETQILEGYRREGRFRAYLKTAVRNFALQQRARDLVARHAEDVVASRLDFEFDAWWVGNLMEQAYERLERLLVNRGELKTWQLLKAADRNRGHHPTYQELAGNFSMSLAEVSQALRRARGILQGIVNLLVGETCSTPEAHGEELHFVRHQP